jgi:hypothetical protein
MKHGTFPLAGLEVLRLDVKGPDEERIFLEVSAAPNLHVLLSKGVHLSPLSPSLFSATNLVDLELWRMEPTNQ